MDETDIRLLAELRRDARASLSDLAVTLGLSRATIRTRIERMRARGDILGFSVVTRADVASSPVRGLMMLGIEGRGTDRLIHRLTGTPQVGAVHSTNGKWDLIVEINAETLEELDRVLSDIRRLEGVAVSETSLLLNTRTGRG